MWLRVVPLAFAAFAGAVSAATAGRAGTAPLLERYEPVLFGVRADWPPIPVETYLGAAELERRIGGQWHVVRKSPPATSLPRASKTVRLDLGACTPTIDLDSCYVRRVRPATRGLPTVYGRVWSSPAGTASPVTTVLQYWLLYAVNDWRDARTKPTTWQIHEGDWELVSVRLDAAGKPVAVAYSQHNLGVRGPWAQARKAGETHPITYVALGSHANYAATGRHVIPTAFSGVPLPEPDFTAADTSFGPAGLAQAELALADVSDGSAAPWLAFAGPWGDGNFVIFGTWTRYGFQVSARVHAGTSPPGPALQRTWRDPLLPFRSWPRDDGH